MMILISSLVIWGLCFLALCVLITNSFEYYQLTQPLEADQDRSAINQRATVIAISALSVAAFLVAWIALMVWSWSRNYTLIKKE